MIKKYQGPLTGLSVIDFGHYYAGPMVAMLLADQGATVIRVVRPGELEFSEPQCRLLNRNKKLLELDLKTPEGKTQAKSLIEKADVVIENFRPGVMKRLGLDYASLKEANPGLIYLSLPGFASTDKERAHLQAWEGILGAACGLYTDTSLVRVLLDYPPVYSWVPLCSTYGASHGAIAIMAALLARKEHGVGTVIEIPLVEAGLSAFGGSVLHAWTFDRPWSPRPVDTQETKTKHEVWDTQQANRFSLENTPTERLVKLSNAQRAFFSPPTFRFYHCADGRQVLVWVIPNAKYSIALFKGLGIYQRLLEEGFVDGETAQNNSLYGLMSPKYESRLIELMTEAFLRKPAEEWETQLGKVVPIALLRTRDEWLALDSMLKSGLNTRMDNGSSTLTVPGRFAEVNSRAGEAPSGEHREMEFITSAQADELLGSAMAQQLPHDSNPLKKGGLLKSLKVLDLSNVVAGPTSSYTLAQYGAQIIKADPPNTMLGLAAPRMTLEIGQGKRSILVDIKTEPGRDVFHRLVSWADVVLHNSLDDVAKRLGITQKQLQAINPNIVSCQISCFGGARPGGWELRPGLDPIPQTATGLMAHFGTLEEPQMHGRTACGDNMGALGLAFSALLATWQQRNTGCAGEGRASMAQANNYVQLPYMIAENGSSDWGEAHGQLALGDHWYQRLYQCRDGWIYVATTKERAAILAETVTGSTQASEKMLEETFAEQDIQHWADEFYRVDIACHRVLSVTDIVDKGVRYVDNEEADETSQHTGEIFCWKDHPCGSPIIIKAPDWVLVGEERSYKRLTPAPIFGQHSKEILNDLGYSKEEIHELIDLKVVHEYQPIMGCKNAYLEPVR